MQQKEFLIGLFLFLMISVTSACSSETRLTPTPDIGTQSVLQITPSATRTSLPRPSVTPTPTLDPFTFSEENIYQIALLNSLGGPPIGKISHLTWSLDGEWLSVSGPDGLFLADSESLTLQWKTSRPDYYSFINGGYEFATLVGEQLKIRQSSDGTLMRTLELKDLQGDRYLISPIGRYLVAQTLEKQLTFWDLENGEIFQVVDLRETFEFDIEGIASIAFNEDGSNLFVATFAGGVYQVAVESGEVKRIFPAVFEPDPGVTYNVRNDCHLLNANGHYLVVVCGYYTPSTDYSTIARTNYVVRWVDVNDGKHQTQYFEIQNSYQHFSLSPDGKSLYIQGVGEFALLQYSPDGIQFNSVPNCLNHSSDPFFLGTSDLNQLAVINGYETGEMFICNLLTGEKQVFLAFEPSSSVAIGLAGDEYRIATGRCTGEIDLWEPRSAQIIRSIQGHTGCVTDLDFSGDGYYLASSGEDGEISIWDLKSESTQPVFTYSHPDPVKDLVLDHNGSHVASISRTEAQLWDTLSGDRLFVKDLDSGRSITFGMGNWMAYSDSDWVTWDRYEGLDTDHILDTGNLVFGPNAKYLGSSYFRGSTVWFFDVNTNEEIYVLDLGSKELLSMAFSLDGCLLIGLPEDEEILFWKTSPIVPLGSIKTGIKHENRVVDAAISPDGRLLVMGTRDGSILVWGVAGALEAPAGPVTSSGTCGILTTPTLSPTAIPTEIPTQTPIPPTTTPVPFSRNIYLTEPKLEGDDVLAVQERLQSLGYSEVGKADGIFGEMTDQAVRNFQSDNDLEVDGSVGQITWEKLFGTE